MSSQNPFERRFERLLFASRWLMAPMYLGLVVSLGMLLVIFLKELAYYAPQVFTMTADQGILAILTLIDLSLAANLLLIVLFSGYENFVSKIDHTGHKDWPEWMGKIDFTGLKLKLLSSIVAISAIQLLKAFMNVKNNSDRDLMWLVIIHVVFVGSGLILALTDKISGEAHGSHASSGNNKADEKH